jgi:hypothetical protein
MKSELLSNSEKGKGKKKIINYFVKRYFYGKCVSKFDRGRKMRAARQRVECMSVGFSRALLVLGESCCEFFSVACLNIEFFFQRSRL